MTMTINEDMGITPMLLSPGDRTVTVFGGGPVALRKSRQFSGFRIRVVSLDVLPELSELAEEIIEADLESVDISDYLDDTDIVVAATSDHALNNRIRDTSMSKGIMTNSAHGGGDILLPSVLHKDGWVVCVSSLGKVPAFPPYVIERIDELLDPSYDSMLELLVLLRKDIRDRIDTQPERSRFLADTLADEEIWGLLKQDRIDDARKLALDKRGISC